CAHHGGLLAKPRLRGLKQAADVFGFHLATVDLRQSSDVHGRVVAELMQKANVTADYLALDEEEKIRLLRKELSQPRLLYSPHLSYSYETCSEISIFETARRVRRRFGLAAVRRYVVSH